MEEINDKVEHFKKICAICHSEKIRSERKSHLFGLIIRNSLMCDNCGATFKEDGGGWEFIDITDKNNAIWKKYGQKWLLSREWINIGNGQLSDEEQRIVDKEKQDAQLKSWLDQISSGDLKIEIIRAENPIILQKNEESLCVLPSIFLYETRAVRVSGGGYGGTSFRVAKGVSIRLGRFGARSESHPEMREIDKGTLVITNKRFIYSGAIKTTQIELRKIVQIDPYDDGIGLHKENREKTQYFSWTDTKPIIDAISARSKWQANKELRKIKEMGLDKNGEVEMHGQDEVSMVPLTGAVLKSIIEGAIKRA